MSESHDVPRRRSIHTLSGLRVGITAGTTNALLNVESTAAASSADGVSLIVSLTKAGSTLSLGRGRLERVEGGLSKLWREGQFDLQNGARGRSRGTVLTLKQIYIPFCYSI